MKQFLMVLFVAVCMVLLTTPVPAIELDELGGVVIHGFLSQGYMWTDENNFFADTEDNGTFQFNEFGINFSTELTDQLRMGIQLLAYDMGDLGNDKVKVDWAFADFHFNDWLGFRVGKSKMTIGLYNEIKDIDVSRTSIMLPMAVYNESWRESLSANKGITAYGTLPLDKLGSLDYTAQVGLLRIEDNGGVIRLLEDQSPGGTSIDVEHIKQDHTVNTCLMWDTPLDGLMIGGSWINVCFISESDFSIPALKLTAPFDFEMVFNAHLASAEYVWGNLTVAAEYAEFSYDYFTKGLSSRGIPDIRRKYTSVGYYGSLSYRFTDWFELGTYYAEYYSDKDDKDGSQRLSNPELPAGQTDYRSWLKDACLTARFDLAASWLLKLEGHAMNGAALLLSSDDNTRFNADTGLNEIDFDENWLLLMAKVTYAF
ncbi:MAG: hypothetical protein CSA22_07870 [Deltaproteobacteria bacterium]|nr:MAG: hypothetical protein CSA22_07870 [Deltaproteobacteria bacterium]